VNHLAIDEAGAGQRVDNFLLRVLKGVPKSHIYRILRSGEVRVNRLRVKPDVRLVLGDKLRIPPIRTGLPAAGKRKPPPLSASIPILYEDDALIAVDKPAGLAVHGGSGVAFGLIEQIRAARPTAKFLELVHRLDRDTSGVLLVAKKRAALVGLHAALREGRVDKRYQILVKGHWRDAKREVTLRQVPEMSSPHAHERSTWRTLRPAAVPLTLLYFTIVLRTATTYGFMTFTPTLLTQQGWTIGEASTAVSLYLFSSGIGGFLGGPAADRIGAKKVILWTLIASVPFMAISPHLPPLGFTAMLAIGGLLLQSTLPISVTFAQAFVKGAVCRYDGVAWGMGASRFRSSA
jgi:23S rRNA-/tRNA-specific pseudouridylate synthase